MSSIQVEPFVYTSLESHFGKGYHMVIRGKSLLKAKKGEAELSRLLIELADLSHATEPVDGYIWLAGAGLRFRVLGLDADWRGRRGYYCTILAANANDLVTRGKSSFIARKPQQLPYMSHDQACSLDQTHGDKFEYAVIMPPTEVSVPDSILQRDDLDWYKTHHRLLWAALEARNKGQSVHVPASLVSRSFLNWLLVLLPPGLRLKTSYVLNRVADLRVPSDISFWSVEKLESLPDGAWKARSNSHPESSMFRAFDDGVTDLVKVGTDIENLTDRIARTASRQDVTIEAFWQIGQNFSEVERMLAGEDTASLPPEEAAEALYRLWQLDPTSVPSVVQAQAATWLTGHFDWLVRLFDSISRRNSREFSGQMTSSLGEGLAAAGLSPAAVFRPLVRIPYLHDSIRCFWKAWRAKGGGDASVSDLEAILQLPAGFPRNEWLSDAVSQAPQQFLEQGAFRSAFPTIAAYLSLDVCRLLFRYACDQGSNELVEWASRQQSLLRHASVSDLNGGVSSIRGEDVKTLVAAISPHGDDAMTWLCAWPLDDVRGRSIWRDYVARRVKELNVENCARLVDMEWREVGGSSHHLASYVLALACATSGKDEARLMSIIESLAEGSQRLKQRWIDYLCRHMSRKHPLYIRLNSLSTDATEAPRVVRFLMSFSRQQKLIAGGIGLLCLAVLFGAIAYRRATRDRRMVSHFLESHASSLPSDMVDAAKGHLRLIENDVIDGLQQYLKETTPAVQEAVAELMRSFCGDVRNYEEMNALLLWLRDVAQSTSPLIAVQLDIHRTYLAAIKDALGTKRATLTDKWRANDWWRLELVGTRIAPEYTVVHRGRQGVPVSIRWSPDAVPVTKKRLEEQTQVDVCEALKEDWDREIGKCDLVTLETYAHNDLREARKAIGFLNGNRTKTANQTDHNKAIRYLEAAKAKVRAARDKEKRDAAVFRAQEAERARKRKEAEEARALEAEAGTTASAAQTAPVVVKESDLPEQAAPPSATPVDQLMGAKEHCEAFESELPARYKSARFAECFKSARFLMGQGEKYASVSPDTSSAQYAKALSAWKTGRREADTMWEEKMAEIGTEVAVVTARIRELLRENESVLIEHGTAGKHANAHNELAAEYNAWADDVSKQTSLDDWASKFSVVEESVQRDIAAAGKKIERQVKSALETYEALRDRLPSRWVSGSIDLVRKSENESGINWGTVGRLDDVVEEVDDTYQEKAPREQFDMLKSVRDAVNQMKPIVSSYQYFEANRRSEKNSWEKKTREPKYQVSVVGASLEPRSDFEDLNLKVTADVSAFSRGKTIAEFDFYLDEGKVVCKSEKKPSNSCHWDAKAQFKFRFTNGGGNKLTVEKTGRVSSFYGSRRAYDLTHTSEQGKEVQRRFAVEKLTVTLEAK